MAYNDRSEDRRRIDYTKLGGFLGGAAITLVLGLSFGVLYSGEGGLGDSDARPPQIYTGF